MFTFGIVTFDIWLQLALGRLGSEALLLCLITLSDWDAAAVTCATPCVCLLLPFPSSPTKPHTAGAGLAFDLACVMSVGDSVQWLSRGVGDSVLGYTQRNTAHVRAAVKILGNYCIAVDTKLILYRRTLKMRRKLRCDTAYWQHCGGITAFTHYCSSVTKITWQSCWPMVGLTPSICKGKGMLFWAPAVAHWLFSEQLSNWFFSKLPTDESARISHKCWIVSKIK